MYRLSSFIEGIESAKMEWSGLPRWLALDHKDNSISGVVPRIPPMQTKLTLKLKAIIIPSEQWMGYLLWILKIVLKKKMNKS